MSAALVGCVLVVGCAGAQGPDAGESVGVPIEGSPAVSVDGDEGGGGVGGPAGGEQASGGGQAAILEDGEVTVVEYQTAFALFVQCAQERGGYVAEVQRNPRSGEILYENTGDLLSPGQTGGSVENECYQEHFAEVEIVFSTTNPAALSEAEQHEWDIWYSDMVPCLDFLEVDYPDDFELYSQEFLDLRQVAIDAIISGDCPTPE